MKNRTLRAYDGGCEMDFIKRNSSLMRWGEIEEMQTQYV